MKEDRDAMEDKIIRESIWAIVNNAINPILENKDFDSPRTFALAMSTLSQSVALFFIHTKENFLMDIKDEDIDRFLKVFSESVKDSIKENINENRN
jgi:hypothetical protein